MSFGMPSGIFLGGGGGRDAGLHNSAQIPKLHVLGFALVKVLLLVGFGKTDGSELKMLLFFNSRNQKLPTMNTIELEYNRIDNIHQGRFTKILPPQ